MMLLGRESTNADQIVRSSTIIKKYGILKSLWENMHARQVHNWIQLLDSLLSIFLYNVDRFYDRRREKDDNSNEFGSGLPGYR